MNTFSIGETIRFGWNTFKARPWFFIATTLLTAVINGIASGITSSFGETGFAAFVGAIISIAVGTFIGIGLTALYLKAHESPASVQLADLWQPQFFWKYLAASILLGLIVMIGLVLLIIPGLIFALVFMFTTYIIVDRDFGPIQALKESRRITKGHMWQLLGLLLAIVGINIVGVLCVVVGLLVSIPVSSLALVRAYRMLEHSASEIVPAA